MNNLWIFLIGIILLAIGFHQFFRKSHLEQSRLSLFSKITKEEEAQESKPSLFDRIISQQDDEENK